MFGVMVLRIDSPSSLVGPDEIQHRSPAYILGTRIFEVYC